MEFFLLDTHKTTFWMENLTQRWTQSGPFFPKLGHFFRFSRRAGKASLLSLSCALVSVAEYVSISLNMSKYLWKCLNKLLWLSKGSEYAWLSYVFDRVLKMPRVPNMQGLFQKEKTSGDRTLCQKVLFSKKLFFLKLNQKRQKQLPIRGDSTSTCPSGLSKCSFVRQRCPFIAVKSLFPTAILI